MEITTEEVLYKGADLMPDKILIVDDEIEIADLVETYLKNENYAVFKFYSAKEALECIQTMEFDLAVLDVMMPEIDGLTLCQKIRQNYMYPVIMLTAKDGEMDKITGLTLGADDYITKPFLPLELVARIKSQLRRYKRHNSVHPKEDEKDILGHLGLEMNIKKHTCSLNGKMLVLTPTEFAILRILLENRGCVISAEELFHRIWADEYYSKSNNTIPVHVRRLREKLNDTLNKPKYIKTIWGVGYKIEEA